MFKPILKISHRTLVISFEVLAVGSLLLLLAFGILIWKVSAGPVSIGWAKDYVEDALSDLEEDQTVTFDNLVFSWPELTGPFYLDLTGLRVTRGKDETNSLSVDQASLGLSRTALLFGRIRPTSVIIKKPSLELVRTQEGHLSLLLKQKPVQENPAQAQQPPEQQIAQIFKDMAGRKRGSMISRLDRFEITDASVAIRDYEYGRSWYLNDFDFAIEEMDQGVAASFDVELPGSKDKTSEIKFDMVYRKKTDDFRASAHIQNLNPYALSRFLPFPETMSGQDLFFSGDVEMSMDTNLQPTLAKFSGSIPEGKILIEQEYDEPIAMKNIQIAGDYSTKDDIADISTLSGEIGGIGFKGGGKATFTDTSVSLPLQIAFSNFALAQVPPLFPKSEREGGAYRWLGGRLEGGNFSNANLNMLLTVNKVMNEEEQHYDWDVDVPDLKLGFDFEGTKVTYSDTLLPVENAKGSGILDLAAQELTITNGTGKLRDIDGADIGVKVTHIMTKGAGMVFVKAKVKGPMATALDYIALEPINMNKERIGIDPKKVKGTLDADLDISLPTLKDVPKEDVKVGIKGTMVDMDVPDLVKGLALTGGPMTLETEEGGFRVKGNAKLAGRDVTADWHQYYESNGNPYSMQIKATAPADHELRAHFGVMLDDYISGTMPVDVVYTSKGDGNSSVDVKGDLTPMRVYISPFKYEKPVGAAGSVSLKASLTNNKLHTISDLNVTAKDLSVKGATLGFATQNGKDSDLSKITLPSATIGKTTMKVDGSAGADNIMKITANGAVFDLEPFLRDDPKTATATQDAQVAKPKKQPMQISLTADTLLAKNEQSVKNAKAYIEMNDQGDMTRIEFDGLVGKSNMTARFMPDSTGKRAFRLATDDAGAALHTFGLYSNVHGGILRIYGEPKDGQKGDLAGSMRMENFRVVKAPALASLLSLMSLTGVSQLLNNQGLVFEKLESGFEWRFRDAGNLLIIKDGKTSGSSIGLTFSGVIDRGKKMTDIAGTIIPMTEINSFLAKIPLVGDILGGATGLIAATYSMKGPSSDPKVTVNPLSVLAPGIIRRILFEGGYENKIPDDGDSAPAKKTTAPKQPNRTVAPSTVKPAPNASAKPANKVNSSKPTN